MAKRVIKLDLSIQLGYFVLQYAKLRMLQFYYDFMDSFVSRSDIEYCEMDTDSAYMAISGISLDSVINPQCLEEYRHGLYNHCRDGGQDVPRRWFPRRCCQQHNTYDLRTPLLFKLEYEGNEVVGLCSKTYLVAGDDNSVKFSCKGINKRSINSPLHSFASVLQTRKSWSRGFRAKDNTVFTYEQRRRGLTYFYCKRQVQNDGIHTKPLQIELCPEQKSAGR